MNSPLIDGTWESRFDFCRHDELDKPGFMLVGYPARLTLPITSGCPGLAASQDPCNARRHGQPKELSSTPKLN